MRKNYLIEKGYHHEKKNVRKINGRNGNWDDVIIDTPKLGYS